ncbi:hypothetical protein [Bifidobacterium thermophilum]|uniref:hypothetical protein n=1 Tax=Bifidobacterium thermophilum TaxID=33905 RepID=UPI0030B03665
MSKNNDTMNENVTSNTNDNLEPKWDAEDFITLRKGMSADDIHAAFEGELAGFGDFHLPVQVCDFRASTSRNGQQIVYSFRGDQWEPADVWSPGDARVFEQYAEIRLAVKFRIDDSTNEPGMELDKRECFGDGLLLADDASTHRMLRTGIDDSSEGVYGLVVTPLNAIIPITDDAVIRFRSIANGRWNCIDIFFGVQWRHRHRKYAMFYRNDKKDEPLIWESIELYEKQLRMLIDTGVNPKIALAN